MQRFRLFVELRLFRQNRIVWQQTSRAYSAFCTSARGNPSKTCVNHELVQKNFVFRNSIEIISLALSKDNDEIKFLILSWLVGLQALSLYIIQPPNLNSLSG
jgi:hypothetical protein